MTPQRIQRKRTKGWRMPEGAVYVGRPTRFGNPFRPMDQRRETVLMDVQRFRVWVTDRKDLFPLRFPPTSAEIQELRGKNLCCWCPLDQPCHADVLLELANEPAGKAQP